MEYFLKFTLAISSGFSKRGRPPEGFEPKITNIYLKIRPLEKIVDPPLLAIIMFQKVIGLRLHFVKSF